MYQMLNIVLTVWACVFFALNDFEYSKEELLKKPMLYSIGIQRELFTPRTFITWIFKAFWQALLILVINYMLYGASPLASGWTFGLWMMGSCVYATITIVANL